MTNYEREELKQSTERAWRAQDVQRKYEEPPTYLYLIWETKIPGKLSHITAVLEGDDVIERSSGPKVYVFATREAAETFRDYYEERYEPRYKEYKRKMEQWEVGR